MKAVKNELLREVYLKYQEEIGEQIGSNHLFFADVGISPKRFQELLDGKRDLLYCESKALAAYFGVSITDLL